MCINAANAAAWYCYFYGQRPTAGKEALVNGRCEACNKVADTVETLPNFMTDEADN